jgi:hypothetical protein
MRLSVWAGSDRRAGPMVAAKAAVEFPVQAGVAIGVCG